jgi:hypothetical protein
VYLVCKSYVNVNHLFIYLFIFFCNTSMTGTIRKTKSEGQKKAKEYLSNTFKQPCVNVLGHVNLYIIYS